jgi:hypothetical protein
MTKLQITLTDQEVELLAQKAALLGYDVTKYAKFVLAQKADEAAGSIPVFKATPKMEKVIKEGLEEDKKGLTKEWKFGQQLDR